MAAGVPCEARESRAKRGTPADGIPATLSSLSPSPLRASVVKSFLLFLLLTALCPLASATESPLLAELQKGLAGTTNVQTEFIQEKTLSLLQRKVVIKGRLAIDQPAKLAWQVVHPR